MFVLRCVPHFIKRNLLLPFSELKSKPSKKPEESGSKQSFEMLGCL
jgi:hypothetical protein